MEVVAGNPCKNFELMSEIIAGAKSDLVDVIVFPELCLSGYLIGDMWEETSFIDDCMHYGNKVAELAGAGLTIIFGNVLRVDTLGSDGRPVKLNAAFVARDGAYVHNVASGICVPKSLLPNYREFEESRHFKNMEWVFEHMEFSYGENTPLDNNCNPLISVHDLYKPYEIDGIKIGLTICEDGWDKDYDVKPIELLAEHGAELILNLSCSPFTTGKNIARDRIFSAHARDNNVPVLYVNSVGLQNNGKTIFTFDGSSVVYNKAGNKIAQLPMFSDYFMDVVYDCDIKNILGEGVEPIVVSETEEIYNALKYGVGKYLEQCGLEKVVIGSSGGVDSAVAAALYAEILGPENLLLVNMPSEFNSKTTINLSAELANNIGCYYTTIPIGESVALTKAQINSKHVINGNGDKLELNLSDFDIENVQARDRSSRILSALSCAFGGVFTNNGNKTETAVGYCTLYGDHAGFLAALADLWKSQVYELGAYLNRDREVIPQGIFDILPSAELSADQSLDAGNGDPLVYWYHDKLFKAWVEKWDRVTPTEIIDWYYKRTLMENLGIDRPESAIEDLFPHSREFVEDLERWWKMFKGMAIAKRVQAPPVMAVSRRAFGFDYRETLNCVYFSIKYNDIKEKLIGRNS